MSDILALLQYIKKMDKGGDTLIKGNTYTPEQIKFAHQLLSDAAKAFDEVRKKPRLSKRRAFIVILEELYHDLPEYPTDLTLDSIHRHASQRFEFTQHSLRWFGSPSDIHPKDPCRFYENNGAKKGNYKVALSHLVTYSQIYFQIEEAAVSLENTYREVLLC
ncbi:MAG: hypothetical protein AAGC45_00910 [Bacteroidota bacterium]